MLLVILVLAADPAKESARLALLARVIPNMLLMQILVSTAALVRVCARQELFLKLNYDYISASSAWKGHFVFTVQSDDNGHGKTGTLYQGKDISI